MDNQPVSFPNWKETLALAKLGPSVEAAFVREIITFLKHCKTHHVPATVLLAKQYVEQRERLSTGPMREALRWFFRSAKAAGKSATPPDGGGRFAPVEFNRSPSQPTLRPMEPKPARLDPGEAEWEKALIKTMRLRGLLWRTEYTYREWAAYRLRHAASAAEAT